MLSLLYTCCRLRSPEGEVLLRAFLDIFGVTAIFLMCWNSVLPGLNPAIPPIDYSQALMLRALYLCYVGLDYHLPFLYHTVLELRALASSCSFPAADSGMSCSPFIVIDSRV